MIWHIFCSNLMGMVRLLSAAAGNAEEVDSEQIKLNISQTREKCYKNPNLNCFYVFNPPEADKGLISSPLGRL